MSGLVKYVVTHKDIKDRMKQRCVKTRSTVHTHKHKNCIHLSMLTNTNKSTHMHEHAQMPAKPVHEESGEQRYRKYSICPQSMHINIFNNSMDLLSLHLHDNSLLVNQQLSLWYNLRHNGVVMELHGEEKLSKLSQLKPGTLSVKDDGSLSVIPLYYDWARSIF